MVGGKILLQRFTRPLRQLQGKLTLAYMLASVVSFLLVEAIVIGLLLWIAGQNVLTFVVTDLKQEAPQAAPYFVHGVPDREALMTWLHIIAADMPHRGPFDQFQPILLSVVDAEAQTLAAVGTQPMPAATLQAQLSPQNWADLRAVLNDTQGTTSLISPAPDHTVIAIAPIMGQPGHLLQGALVMRITQPDRLHLFSYFLSFTTLTVIAVTTIAAIAGLVFGSLTARSLTHRLARLSTAAERWSRGDFSAMVYDTSQDELGQLARQLNRMAEQLQNLLQTRRNLAMLEERNRLARDLHDSVKQQVFTLAMQIGATRLLLKRDVAAAEVRLHEAEQLVRQTQQELTALIRELRPVALVGKGLVAALRELITQWAGHTSIVATLAVEGAYMPSLNVEDALFRVTQEALANVARHSHASCVHVLLTTTEDMITLTVTDNGQGFSGSRPGRSGVGLLSMHERMQTLGGDVQVESEASKGTRIIVRSKRLIEHPSDVTTPYDEEAQSR